MTFKKIILFIHLWLGLISGLVVFILGITGCIYVFEKELRDVIYAKRIFVDERKAHTISVDTLKAIAQKSLGNERPIGRLEYRPNSDRTYIFSAEGYVDDAILYTNQYKYSNKVYINQYTGKVQYVENTKWEFFMIVLSMHYDLMLGKVGHVITPWATVIFVIMLITGLILWWPKNKAAAKQRFWFKWKKKTKWKRKNYDLHNISGFYVLIITLFISLAGLAIGFGWFRDAVKSIANRGVQTLQIQRVQSDTTITVKTINLDKILSINPKQFIDAESFVVVFPDNKTSTLSVRAYNNSEKNVPQEIVFFDQNSGNLLASRPYDKLSTGDKLLANNYDIHVGKILSLPGMILAFIGSLVAASLPITGFMIWYGRRNKSKQL